MMDIRTDTFVIISILFLSTISFFSILFFPSSSFFYSVLTPAVIHPSYEEVTEVAQENTWA
jgi:hypothetical protein